MYNIFCMGKNNSDVTTGKRIANLRTKEGLTQKELSVKIDIPWTMLSDYERGKTRINENILRKLASVFHISVDELLGVKSSSKTEKEHSLKIMRRMKEIEKLPLSKQKFILQTIDSLIRDAKASK